MQSVTNLIKALRHCTDWKIAYMWCIIYERRALIRLGKDLMYFLQLAIAQNTLKGLLEGLNYQIHLLKILVIMDSEFKIK